jgi:uncharacterized protein
MRWERLLFLHWRWDPREIQKSLPAELTVDTFDGSAWLAVVPFHMRRVHPYGLFPLPLLSEFAELNVRTYVRGPDGTPGVWFYSLACNQPFAVLMARGLFGLNYVRARMRVTDGPTTLFYSRRPGRQPARLQYAAASAGTPATPGSLDEFLLERYVLYSKRGRLLSGRVHHSPYRIAPPMRLEWSFLPAVDDGFEHPRRSPDHAVTAEPVNVTAWAPRPVGGQS